MHSAVLGEVSLPQTVNEEGAWEAQSALRAVLCHVLADWAVVGRCWGSADHRWLALHVPALGSRLSHLLVLLGCLLDLLDGFIGTVVYIVEASWFTAVIHPDEWFHLLIYIFCSGRHCEVSLLFFEPSPACIVRLSITSRV